MTALRRVFAVAFLATSLAAFALPSPLGAKVVRHGVLRAVVSDDFERQASTTAYSLQSGGETTPILPTSPPSAETGDVVVVRGTMREGRLVGSIVGDGDSALGPIFAGPRRVAVLLVKFAGDPAVPWSPQETREKVFTGDASAAAYFREESNGIISLQGKADPEEGDVFGWFTLSSSGFGCSAHAWGSEAFDLAFESGIPFGGYHHFVYVFTHRPGCIWSGMATLGGNSGTAYLNGNVGVKTIAHEFGHNFGLQHAGSWTCTEGGVRVQISDSCSVKEYGDPFDAMGNVSTRHNNGWNLAKLGLFGPERVVTVAEDGTYALGAAFGLPPTLTILRVPRTKDAVGNVTSWYYLEVRKRGGIFEDVDDGTMTGVSIRATASGSSPETLLLDSNPATSTFADAPLQVGGTFSDGMVRIKTLSAGGGAASASVDFLALGDSEPPTAPTDLAASQEVTGVRLQWDPSTDDSVVSRYVVFRDGSQIGVTPTPAFTDKGATLGPHAYTVYAEDAAGNRSEASEPEVVTVVDMLAPTAPTGLSASQEVSGVSLRWTPSTDNVGVSRYVVFRDGSQIGASPVATFADTGIAPGEHTYTVYAEDEAGNRSAASKPRVVTVFDWPEPSIPPSPLPGPVPPGPTGEEPPAPTRPTLRWERQRNGALAFELDAHGSSDVVRVSLWLDRRLLRSKKGRTLHFVWKPKVVRCGRVYRFIARAHSSSGRQAASTVHLRSSRLRNASGKCRLWASF